MNDLLLTLEILDLLMRRAGPVSASTLCERFGISVATLKRRLADARSLGAHVESLKAGATWRYHLGNAEVVAARLVRWIELERSRSLV